MAISTELAGGHLAGIDDPHLRHVQRAGEPAETAERVQTKSL